MYLYILYIIFYLYLSPSSLHFDAYKVDDLIEFIIRNDRRTRAYTYLGMLFLEPVIYLSHLIKHSAKCLK